MGHGAPARLRRLSQRRGLGGLSGAFIGSRELHALLRGQRKGWGARAGAEGDFGRGRRERGPLITRDPPAVEPRRARSGAKRFVGFRWGNERRPRPAPHRARNASGPHHAGSRPCRAVPRGAATLGRGSGCGAGRVCASASGGERGARAACRCCALLGAAGTAPCAGHGRVGPGRRSAVGAGSFSRRCRFWKGFTGIWRLGERRSHLRRKRTLVVLTSERAFPVALGEESRSLLTSEAAPHKEQGEDEARHSVWHGRLPQSCSGCLQGSGASSATGGWGFNYVNLCHVASMVFSLGTGQRETVINWSIGSSAPICEGTTSQRE
ncbi:uncharacterized protein [Excalfactoria chinensis]|uniref:uncharacterized protein n=1 Tax=Excalfactoria chinensis TaxID=46218 RepID=UPI003B3B853F